MPTIPAPEYITDLIDGAVRDLLGKPALIIGSSSADAPLIARGTLAVRYAIPALMPPTDAVIPGLFVAERGGALTGREAWDYLQNRFQMHPRADVIGLKQDGARGEYLVRELDFGAPIRVFAYAHPDDSVPLTELFALAAPDANGLPDLLVRYLPRTAPPTPAK